MKRFLLYLLAITIIIACSEGDDVGGGNNNNETPKQPEITLDATTSNFATDGGSSEITFTSSTAWTAEVINSRADVWCNVNPTSGAAGDAKITVTTTANDTPDDRTASIIIKAGTASKTINVSQKQKDALTVTSSKFEVSAEGGEVSIEVKANIDFEYSIEESAKDWVEYKTTRAMKTSNLVFEVKDNEDFEKREAKITIKSGEFSEVVTIYQAGAEPTIVISQNEYVVSSDGDTIAVEVASNVDVTVELPTEADWVTENTTRGVSTNTYYFDIAPSEEYDQRNAEIKFTNSENGLSEIVSVVQTQKDALVVAKDSYTVDSDGGQIQIEVGHNVDFDVEISADWITREQTRAYTTETLTFDIAKNPTNDNREGTIIFKSKDGSLSQTVKVYQAQEDALIISKKDIVVGEESGTISFEIQANVEFSVSEPDVDWLRAVTTRGLTSHTLTYEYDANTTYDSREAQIVVTNIKTNESETITITQAQKDAIVLAKDSYIVDSDGGQIQIEVGHNIDFDVEISADWITREQTRAYTTETLTFEIAKNPTNDNREGTITFKSKDGSLSQSVKVYQAQEDALII
ncbi:MAG: BACON domain-containing protein, partial [Alistipes sp.]|nr:BACON domain-containing protein [Alistipes sp.]